MLKSSILRLSLKKIHLCYWKLRERHRNHEVVPVQVSIIVFLKYRINLKYKKK